MIVAPVVYDGDDKVLVDAFEAQPRPERDANYWSHADVIDLRARVKTFYIAAQGTRCCYCNRHLGTESHRAWDVEHVVDRNKHPWFMFTPTNLAAACPECNIAKSTTQVLVNAGRVTYPTAAAAFKIIHPHFDQFDDHIRRVGHIYLPKTPKGKFTIYTCDLLRFAEKYIAWENSATDTRFETAVNAAFADGPMAQGAVEEIIAQLSGTD